MLPLLNILFVSISMLYTLLSLKDCTRKARDRSLWSTLAEVNAGKQDNLETGA